MAKKELENLDIYTARWFNNADSPVNLMIDGLNNSLIHPDPAKSNVPGSDRGHLRNLPGSTWSLFQENLLKRFDDLKVTLFLTVGDHYSKAVPPDEIPFNRQFDPQEKEFVAFLKEISATKQVSIGYNGYNYFSRNEASGRIDGEYEELPSAKEAEKRTREGLDLFEKTLGYRPNGGKFPGFRKNDRSVEGIKSLGLSYWCTGFAPLELAQHEDDAAFNLHAFEGSDTMHFPTTFHGSSNVMANIDFLLERQKVISIIESYSRFDHNGIQLPNLIDDMNNLVALLTYLSDRKVWFAEIEEIVDYYKLFHDTKLERESNDGFSFHSLSKRKFGFNDYLTIILHGLDDNTDYAVICPHGIRTKVDNRRELFRTVTLPVRDGLYKILPL